MKEVATFGGGCFWSIEAMFKEIKGVEKVVSGYAGGRTDNPNYENMHYEETGHAEVVQVTFDPNVISYEDLLKVFFSIHDPTTLNRQGYDIGEEYRSIILYQDTKQQKTAEKVIKEFVPTLWDKPIATQLVPLKKFWPAEEFHQNFYAKNPNVGYCQVVINPKLAKFHKQFADKLKTKS